AEHCLPLTQTSSALLEHFIEPCKTWNKPKRRLDAASGVSNWKIHHLRHSFSTHLNELGVHPHIVERILAHKIPGVAGVYNHALYMQETKTALELWEAELVKRGVIS